MRPADLAAVFALAAYVIHLLGAADPRLGAALAAAGADRVAAEFTIELNGARLAELLDLDANTPQLVRS